MTTANPPLTLAAVLPPERVRASLLATSREALFAALVDLALPTASAAERRVALAAVLHRESELPTAMGDGL
ncbi:MAG: PTS sugar transporter subunit IIA, partial [Gemmatimonadaceae bacterium]|nr:PTS sugar transporter subunit IIA [Gemmatimonadaceae bacterium]